MYCKFVICVYVVKLQFCHRVGSYKPCYVPHVYDADYIGYMNWDLKINFDIMWHQR